MKRKCRVCGIKSKHLLRSGANNYICEVCSTKQTIEDIDREDEETFFEKNVVDYFNYREDYDF